MNDLGFKVTKLLIKITPIERRLGLTPIVFNTQFTSNYYNRLTNRVRELYIRVNRLERTLGISGGARGRQTQLKNIGMKITALNQRVIRIQRVSNTTR